MGRKAAITGAFLIVLLALAEAMNPEMEPYSLSDQPLPELPERPESRQI
jgi:hypothetical protein